MRSERSFQTLGNARVRAEFTRAHIHRLQQWFDARGHFRQPGPPPSSRERLWNCFSLLQGDAAAVRLANRIILNTPIDANHFEPITAVELLLRHPRQLTPAARDHLRETVQRHYANLLEWRFGTHGMHNFVCMTTFFLLAAPRVLARFDWPHEFASIPEVYSRYRMQEIGLNALELLLFEWTQRPISTEFQPDLLFHHDGDVPFNWSGPAWIMATRYSTITATSTCAPRAAGWCSTAAR